MFVGLSLIGVPYALLLALVAGIFEIIPIAGPLFSALVGVSVAFLVSPVLAFLTLLFYGALQQIENHVLVPLFLKKITGLNPVVVIVALLVGAKLGGIMGMLIAVPLATIGRRAIDDLAKKKRDQYKSRKREAATTKISVIAPSHNGGRVPMGVMSACQKA